MESGVEANIIERCCRGDREAFARLLFEYREDSYRFAYRLTGTHQDADDLLQETWMRAFQSIGDFAVRSEFRTWLWRIMLGCAVDRRRQRGGRKAERRMPAGLRSSPATDPWEQVKANETRARVGRALSDLPPEQAHALILVAEEGLSYARGAQVQNCPEGTFAWRVFAARQRLLEELSDE